MSQGKRLISSATWNLIAYGVSIVSVLILTPVLIKSYGVELYGMWVLIGAFVSQFGLLHLGLPPTTVRFASDALAREDDNRFNEVLSTSLFMLGCLAAVFAVAIGIAAALSDTFFPTDAELAALFCAVLLIRGLGYCIQVPVFAIQGSLSARLLYDRMAIIQCTAALINLPASIWVAVEGYSLIWLAWINVGTLLFDRLLLLFVFRYEFPSVRISTSLISMPLIREMLRHGWYVFLSVISSFGKLRLASFVIASFASLAAVALFSLAARLLDYIEILMTRVFAIFVPVFARYAARGEEDDLYRAFFFIHRINLIMTFTATGALICYGAVFLDAWIGEEALGSYEILVVLAAMTIASRLHAMPFQLLTAQSKHSRYSILMTVEMVASIVLSLPLTYYFGALGFAFGALIPTLILRFFVFPIYLARASKITVVTFFGTAIPVAVMSFLLQTPAFFVAHMAPGTYALAILGVGAAYHSVLILVLLRLHLTRQDRDMLIGAFPLERVKPMLRFLLGVSGEDKAAATSAPG